MANKNNGNTDLKVANESLELLNSLNKVTKQTQIATYGVAQHMEKLSEDVFDFGRASLNKNDSVKSQINSHISQYNSTFRNVNKENYEGLYEIIKDDNLVNSLQSVLGTHNVKLKELMQDYEIVKRCIPQVHKVLVSLKNNIISPDSITKNSVGIKFPSSMGADEKKQLSSLTEKYKINTLIDKIVMEYLVVSVKYISVVPYKHIVDMLQAGKPLNECIQYVNDACNDSITTLLEACGDTNSNLTVLTEAADSLPFVDKDGKSIKIPQNELREADKLLKELLESIEFIDGGMAYFKEAIINEAVNIDAIEEKEQKSMKAVYKKLSSTQKSMDNVSVVDGVIDDKMANDLRKKVEFKGCHIEEMDATRVIPFKMRDTLVGYFYVEDKIGIQQGDIQQAGIMEKINSTMYQRATNATNKEYIENLVVKTVGDKIIKSINPKFLTDNMDDISIIYEFVRDNEIHTKAKRVVFFHPDDVVEFRRPEGSIMKNCMFMAKLFILTTLSNTITNVTRGADRNFYYVKTGLSTDVSGHVNKAIRAIKQNQVRYSDIGTINDVFNIIGSNVDVFMPMSPDGEKPIETEVVSGQTVEMQSEFITWLAKSIILSFGVPSVVIDSMDEVELAKTLSMSNLDIARAVLEAQVDIIEPLTKLLRTIAYYECPEASFIDEMEASLNPPTAIILEMNKELIDSVSDMGDKLSELIIPPPDEQLYDKKKRLFKLAYFRKNTPSIDWDEVNEMIKNVEIDAKYEEAEDKLVTPQDNQDGM